MVKWKQYKIGDLCTPISETYRGKDEEVILINTSDVLEGEILNHEKVPNQNLKGQFKKTFKKNDILFSEIRPANKRYAFVNLDDTSLYIASTKLMVLRPNIEIVRPRYLYAILSSESIINELQHLAETRSGTFPQITFSSELAPMAANVPDFDTQDRIIKMLDILEGKISCNKKINENIEKQGKALFESWFVNFEVFDDTMVEAPNGMNIPKSLKMIQINDIPHSLESGKRPKGGAVSEGIPSVGAENVKKLGEFDFSTPKYVPIEFAEKMRKGKIQGYELLLYKDGGKPGTFIPHFSMFGEGFPYDEFYVNEHVFVLDFYDIGFNEFAYYYMHTDYPYSWLVNNGEKAAVPGINQQDVNAIWIFDPENEKVKEFGKIVQPIFKSIFKNCIQNVKLVEMKKNLIPRLVSGKMEIPEL